MEIRTYRRDSLIRWRFAHIVETVWSDGDSNLHLIKLSLRYVRITIWSNCLYDMCKSPSDQTVSTICANLHLIKLSLRYVRISIWSNCLYDMCESPSNQTVSTICVNLHLMKLSLRYVWLSICSTYRRDSLIRWRFAHIVETVWSDGDSHIS
jgi:hypothetical protein